MSDGHGSTDGSRDPSPCTRDGIRVGGSLETPQPGGRPLGGRQGSRILHTCVIAAMGSRRGQTPCAMHAPPRRTFWRTVRRLCELPARLINEIGRSQVMNSVRDGASPGDLEAGLRRRGPPLHRAEIAPRRCRLRRASLLWRGRGCSRLQSGERCQEG